MDGSSPHRAVYSGCQSSIDRGSGQSMGVRSSLAVARVESRWFIWSNDLFPFHKLGLWTYLLLHQRIEIDECDVHEAVTKILEASALLTRSRQVRSNYA